MAHQFTFTVNVTMERDEGKFESRDAMADFLREALEGVDPGTFQGDNGGTYSVTDWQVDDA